VSVRIAASAISALIASPGPESRNSPKRASAISAHAIATAAALIAITGAVRRSASPIGSTAPGAAEVSRTRANSSRQ
jgi:hypothetical protein